MYGKNQVLQVMVTLVWWGETAWRWKEQQKPAWDCWLLAVADVKWVLEEVLASGEIKRKRKRSGRSDGSEDEEQPTELPKKKRGSQGAAGTSGARRRTPPGPNRNPGTAGDAEDEGLRSCTDWDWKFTLACNSLAKKTCACTEDGDVVENFLANEEGTHLECEARSAKAPCRQSMPKSRAKCHRTQQSIAQVSSGQAKGRGHSLLTTANKSGRSLRDPIVTMVNKSTGRAKPEQASNNSNGKQINGEGKSREGFQ
ncbi:hypothetical protein C8R45DRAFT_923935 [Mycena sanguinolenta]|nr:hypothetical protein C8R45DRAFT_923935 [Mycena sanguinolenta]